SQTAVMKRFLVSFARQNELFGEIGEARVPRVADGAVQPDGNVSEWKDLAPVVLDPVNDSLLRDFQAGGGVNAVYACRDRTALYLRVDTYQPVSDRMEFRVRLRYFGDAARAEAGGAYTASVRAAGSASPPDIRAAVRANRVEMAIPLREIAYAHRFALNVET